MARSANKLPHQTENDKPNFAKLPFKIVTFIRHILRSNKLKALDYICRCIWTWYLRNLISKSNSITKSSIYLWIVMFVRTEKKNLVKKQIWDILWIKLENCEILICLMKSTWCFDGKFIWLETYVRFVVDRWYNQVKKVFRYALSPIQC